MRLWELTAAYISATSLVPMTVADGVKSTHEAGRCSMRGSAKSGLFSPELPYVDNGKAEKPLEKTRDRLVSICGTKWRDVDRICCDDHQLDAMESNFKKAESIIDSCPACKENFFNLFCTFTCSPDQSLFVNITDTTGGDRPQVNELDTLWSDGYGSGFYDSCKDVKFGAVGGKAMDFIGGGAKNYSEFLTFLGHKDPFFGSPFQINFPRPEGREKDGMKAANPKVHACSDSDYRCACVDCPAVCPELPEIKDVESCHMGSLPCLSFASMLVYVIGLVFLVTAIVGHIAYARHNKRRSERLQLLQDTNPSDDEDEGDVVHSAGMLDRPHKNYKLNAWCDKAFYQLGRACAKFPLVTIGLSVILVGGLSIGWKDFAVEYDPVRLWVSPKSAAAQEKEFYDKNFDPFYRTEQVFLVNDTARSDSHSPVLSYDTLRWWFDVEQQIARFRANNSHITLSDVCFNPTGDACVVESVTGYFHGDFDRLDPDTWQETLRHCLSKPSDAKCLPRFGQPIDKDLVIGGWDHTDDPLDAQAMITTWLIVNHPKGSEAEQRAIEWEQSLRRILRDVGIDAKDRGLRLSYSAEISLEQELNKSTSTDAKIVVISYVVMFIYVAFALGSVGLSMQTILRNPSTLLIESKLTLAIIGIVIVLMSVSASVGLFSAAGIKTTLIIAEVIPFLVLAVGVDNIFLIVHEFERINISHPDKSIDVRMAKALGRMGPSILLSASTETVAFALGCFVGMPAVKNFAAYAAGAVAINALLQVTMFVSVLALNQRRVEANRVDCFPFAKISRNEVYDISYSGENESSLQKFIRKTYAPMLLGRKAKTFIMTLFLGIFALGVGYIPTIELGLDQKIAIPSDSYLIDYFKDLERYFNAGPPVYFVTREANVTNRKTQQSLCSLFTSCDSYSLGNVLEQESKRTEISYIKGSTANWLDDHFFWLKPKEDGCCEENGHQCFKNRDPPWNITLYGMPQGQEFNHYVEKWLKSPSTAECPKGGTAYTAAVVPDFNRTTIHASSFRTSHSPLRTQEDFIKSYASARRIADGLSDDHNLDIFPYSKHYIFFDQYASIVNLTGTLLGSALAIIFVITSLLLGSIITGALISITVVMIVVDILGTMAIANVSLNAVSLVNLVICVGIGVEFCAHIARAFMFPSKTVMEKGKNKFRGRDARVWTALVNVGGSVFSGLTITKALGIFVLAFTRSKIFELYYIRIWLALVFWSATHALVFLPVLLSFLGGEGYIDPESDAFEDDLAARRYRALIPDDYDDSDEEYDGR